MPEPATPITAFHRFGKLLLATSALGRFLTSEDDATSWDLMQASTKAFFTDCAFDPLRGAIVMTGHNGDVLRSPDGGRTWEGSEISIDGNKNYPERDPLRRAQRFADRRRPGWHHRALHGRRRAVEQSVRRNDR